MTDHASTAHCPCASAEQILADLAGDLLRLQDGDRLWQLYCFRVPGDPNHLRHRIYTVLKPSGRLALVTFAEHDLPAPPTGDNGAPALASVRSAIMRVPDLSPADLARLIEAIRQQTSAREDADDRLDLSELDSLAAQIAWLRRADQGE